MISLKHLVIILLIIFLLTLIIKQHNSKNKNNNFVEAIRLIENMQDTNIYVRDEIILEEMSYPEFEENFKFDPLDKVTNNIEKFFNTYLDLINTNRINQKLNEYLENKGNLNIISMQDIFTLKNINIAYFYDNIFEIIDNIYFANSHYINEDRLKLYALFKIIRTKFWADGGKFQYYYHNNQIILLPEPMRNFVVTEESLKTSPYVKNIRNMIECGKVNKIPNSTDNEVCVISIKDYAGNNIRDRYNNDSNIIQNIRNELANNLDRIILLCELLIVRNLILIYNDINTDYENILVNLRKTDKFKNLETEIINMTNTIRNYEPTIKDSYNRDMNINNIVAGSLAYELGIN